jgi:hypothetical protein
MNELKYEPDRQAVTYGHPLRRHAPLPPADTLGLRSSVPSPSRRLADAAKRRISFRVPFQPFELAPPFLDRARVRKVTRIKSRLSVPEALFPAWPRVPQSTWVFHGPVIKSSCSWRIGLLTSSDVWLSSTMSI